MKIYYAIGLGGHLDKKPFKLVRMAKDGTRADLICQVTENVFSDEEHAMHLLNKLNDSFTMAVEIQKRNQ